MIARAEAYGRHTGRYGPQLSAAFLTLARVEPGSRVLDVGAERWLDAPDGPFRLAARAWAVRGRAPFGHA